MKKLLTLSIIFGALISAGFSCDNTSDVLLQKNTLERYQTAVENNTTKITYYISPNGSDSKLKYCNGSEMDSEGYKNLLTKQVTVTVAGKLAGDTLINRTLNLAAQAAEFSPNVAETEDYVRVDDGVAKISPIEGWAGVSIYMCAWKPFVEKNLEQFGEISKVEWVSQINEFENI